MRIIVETRVPVKQAAKELHMSVLTLQCLMQQERLPIGYAVKHEGSSKYCYAIYRSLLDSHKERLGIKD